jgi:hypothetical protein
MCAQMSPLMQMQMQSKHNKTQHGNFNRASRHLKTLKAAPRYALRAQPEPETTNEQPPEIAQCKLIACRVCIRTPQSMSSKAHTAAVPATPSTAHSSTQITTRLTVAHETQRVKHNCCSATHTRQAAAHDSSVLRLPRGLYICLATELVSMPELRQAHVLCAVTGLQGRPCPVSGVTTSSATKEPQPAACMD